MTPLQTTIHTEFFAMLKRGLVPCFEYPLSNGEYLLVHLELSDKGLHFSFDSDGMAAYFDGIVTRLNNNHYLIAWDNMDEDTNLDSLLCLVDDNISEGYLLPNGLFASDL
jgi:hypothetical protein